MRESSTLHDLLLEANRVLIVLEALGPGERHPGVVILETREIYSQMLGLLGKKSLTTAEAISLQRVMDRINTSLRFFGESS